MLNPDYTGGILTGVALCYLGALLWTLIINNKENKYLNKKNIREIIKKWEELKQKEIKK